MPEWKPMFALPNLMLRRAIEVDGFAMAPADDARVLAMRRKHRRFGSFMKRFKTEFGETVEPTVIIWRDDKPDSYRTISAISGFRDLVSMCVIPHAWAQALRYGPRHGALYSDYFSVYPWMTDNKNEGLITKTPAMFGSHEVRRLRASSTAALSPHVVEDGDIDNALLNELTIHWDRCFSSDTPSIEDERLFRSLNMANAAAMLPLGADTKLYDALRSVALWASAFEIMRPAKNQAYKGVYAMLEGITWNYTPCVEKTYQAFGDPVGTLRALPSWLFGEINHLRNDTLHGNPIGPGRMVVAPGKQSLNMYAAPLYRMAISAYVDLKFKGIQPPTDPIEPYIQYRGELQDFGSCQRDIEVALSTIFYTHEEYQALRKTTGRRRAGTLEQ